MGIRDRGYRAWEGQYTSHAMRWWTVAKQALRATVHSKPRLFGLLFFTAVVWAPFIFFGLFWFLAGVSELGEVFGSDTDTRLRLDLFHLYQGWSVAIVPLYVATVAAPFVSNDLRSNALYIYLSKPLRRVDYILGKATAAILWGIPVTLLPTAFVVMMAVGSTDKATRFQEATEILFEALLAQALLLLVVVTITLAASSLTKRWWIALSGFMGAHFILWIVSNILQEAIRPPGGGLNREWMILALSTNLDNVSRKIFEQPAPEFGTSLAWTTSLWIIMAVIVASLGVFLWRILRLEVAE